MTNLRELLAKAELDAMKLRSYAESEVGWVDSHGFMFEAAGTLAAMKNALPGLLDKVERYEAALLEIASFGLGKVSRVATKALEGAGHADG